jgi:putative redox protein
MHVEVETRNVGGQVMALGSAGPYTLVIDRPVEGGGGGLGSTAGSFCTSLSRVVSPMISSETHAWPA